MPAKAATELFLGAVPRRGIDLRTYDVFQCPHAVPVSNCLVPGTSTGGPTVASEVMLLILTACFLAAVLALTARRTRVAPATLAIGVGAGLALGVAMYAVAPLGFNPKFPDRPWHGSPVDLFVALAWILLFGAPLTAGAIAGRRVAFPIIGAWMGMAGAGYANATGPLPDGGRPPGPPAPPGPEPVPDPPDGGRLADARAGQDRLPGRYDDGEGDQGPPGLVGAGLAEVVSRS